MTADQITLFALLGVIFALLIWGRIRYDIVAFGALVVAVGVGVVDQNEAFAGFGHPAVIIIALVLVVSRGLVNSGAIEAVARHVVDASRSLFSHIAIMAGVGAALSTVMNNVGALALMMPLDVQAAAKAGRSPSLTLMPLSFATILGGLVTLIGTPPNIIIASFREQEFGEAFKMFDFAPVGIVAAVAGVAFVALIGWRLLPAERREQDSGAELFEVSDYIAEVRVKSGSKTIGKQVRELDDVVEEIGCVIVGLVRRGKRLPGQARRQIVRKGDIFVIQGAPQTIEELVGALDLEYVGGDKHRGIVGGGDTGLLEVVVQETSRINGRSALDVRLLYNHGVTLLGVSRQGRRFHDRVRQLKIRPGDILLLFGANDRLGEIAEWLGALPLAERGLQVIKRETAWLAVGIFAAAIALASFELVYLPIALAGACVLMALLGIVPVRELYASIEWPVIVLLGSLIPIGNALQETGGTALIADGIVTLTVGAAPWVVLTVLMVVTMTLSDVLNNTATAIVAAPVAVTIAERLGVNPDPFLMAVAISASCAFLTPIGHKNNTLIMGPGGYQFGDYWRMGLPLEILVIAVSVPMLLIVWPF
ncbi:sodium-dependent dicarboxylate transporter SdcS [bacterium BMS3Bbin10]|nr:sodium-dependent dicarboxylate transporter SdcS [bacterium BMS3Bbin10]